MVALQFRDIFHVPDNNSYVCVLLYIYTYIHIYIYIYIYIYTRWPAAAALANLLQEQGIPFHFSLLSTLSIKMKLS